MEAIDAEGQPRRCAEQWMRQDRRPHLESEQVIARHHRGQGDGCPSDGIECATHDFQSCLGQARSQHWRETQQSKESVSFRDPRDGCNEEQLEEQRLRIPIRLGHQALRAGLQSNALGTMLLAGQIREVCCHRCAHEEWSSPSMRVRVERGVRLNPGFVGEWASLTSSWLDLQCGHPKILNESADQGVARPEESGCRVVQTRQPHAAAVGGENRRSDGNPNNEGCEQSFLWVQVEGPRQGHNQQEHCRDVHIRTIGPQGRRGQVEPTADVVIVVLSKERGDDAVPSWPRGAPIKRVASTQCQEDNDQVQRPETEAPQQHRLYPRLDLKVRPLLQQSQCSEEATDHEESIDRWEASPIRESQKGIARPIGQSFNIGMNRSRVECHMMSDNC
mmetsp:Transcript_82937/g.173647  ORF Transcript_82937/g.173647 Transcript_82937/m.173647 type:complete len:390 (-) Transcript_82937:274-1443(-)